MLNHVKVIRPGLLTIAMLLVGGLWLSSARAEDTAAVAAEAGDSFVIGAGLVIGLPGTGDSAVDEGLVERSIVGVLKRAGVDAWKGRIEPGRIAKVIVMAEVPPDGEPGTPLAITVTAVGDATSLAGGTLLATPLRRTNGKVHAVAQGQIATGDRAATVDGRQENSRMGGREVGMAEGGIVIGRAQEMAAN